MTFAQTAGNPATPTKRPRTDSVVTVAIADTDA
jgi:hypothetical protein